MPSISRQDAVNVATSMIEQYDLSGKTAHFLLLANDIANALMGESQRAYLEGHRVGLQEGLDSMEEMLEAEGVVKPDEARDLPDIVHERAEDPES